MNMLKFTLTLFLSTFATILHARQIKFLDSGQKVENDAIFIVPKGEELQVSV